jgi:hypothetical protein
VAAIITMAMITTAMLMAIIIAATAAVVGMFKAVFLKN